MENPAETDGTEAVNQCRLAQELLQGFFLLKDNVVHNNLICQEDVESPEVTSCALLARPRLRLAVSLLFQQFISQL